MNGIYIHIPFCRSKCPYCDFYSLTKPVELQGSYVSALIDEIKTNNRLKGIFDAKTEVFDTIYLGGGTPSVLSGEELYNIITTLKENYKITDDAFFATLYCPTDSYSSPFAKPVIGIWFYDYDLCKEKGVCI